MLSFLLGVAVGVLVHKYKDQLSEQIKKVIKGDE